MTRPVPDSRTPALGELDCVSDPMDGYFQCAAEAVADHGNTITDTHPHTLAAAYMQGAAMIHAAEVIGDYMCRQFDLQREVMKEIAQSITLSLKEHGEAVSTAIEVHSESVDRMAEAIESGDGDLANGAALLEMVAANRRAARMAEDAARERGEGAS